MAITERDIDTLRDLRDSGWTWHTPLMIGGSCRSHHSRTLSKLVRHGLVERKQRSSCADGRRGSWKYKITEKGVKALEAPDDTTTD
jgi:predicted transcriptional regulator